MPRPPPRPTSSCWPSRGTVTPISSQASPISRRQDRDQCVNPLGFDADGPYGLVLEESAAQETQRLVPTARVIGAFHHVAALSLWKTPTR
ncbi:hypothetical protein [Aeromicrobium sp. UC242_57]|uniref:hypothetical protein n=1 Tax=Aeromicrobium sp. UC242_57 TaxID=3374624 RepID=UPI003799F861